MFIITNNIIITIIIIIITIFINIISFVDLHLIPSAKLTLTH